MCDALLTGLCLVVKADPCSRGRLGVSCCVLLCVVSTLVINIAAAQVGVPPTHVVESMFYTIVEGPPCASSLGYALGSQLGAVCQCVRHKGIGA